MLPAPAIHWPSVVVWPDRFITYARRGPRMTVSVAHFSWFSVSP